MCAELIFQFTGYVPSTSTNLLTHLQNVHADLSAPAQPTKPTNTASNNGRGITDSGFEIPEELLYADDGVDEITPGTHVAGKYSLVELIAALSADDVPVALPTKLGTRYVEDIVQTERDGSECSICFEEFVKGAAIARMECFCVFHTTCIDAWLKRTGKCPLHKD